MPAQLVLITNAWIPETVLEEFRDACAACADLLDEPVHFWRVRDGVTLAALRDTAGNTVEMIPPRCSPSASAMSSAPFVYRPDGRPDWRAMWTDFCDLALLGGPPHRGPESVLRAAEDGRPGDGSLAPVEEIRRGIWETTGMDAELAKPGWLSVQCDSERMAAWMCAAIILENVDVACAGTCILVPASEAFTIEDEVKSVITVVAKTHHYWTEHFRLRQSRNDRRPAQ